MTLEWTARAILKMDKTIERYEKAEQMRKEGKTFSQIGVVMGVSKSRVQNMLVSLEKHRERLREQ